MNNVIFQIQLLHHTWVITPWKLVGYAGVLVFAGRWFVQMVASHQAGRSYLPRLFWYMSLFGSVLLISYFTCSEKKDSVGLLSNLFPASVAAFNLILERRRDILTRMPTSSNEPGTK